MPDTMVEVYTDLIRETEYRESFLVIVYSRVNTGQGARRLTLKICLEIRSLILVKIPLGYSS